ncbi:uncharacterized [Tachysurus ichikawai]
MTQFSDGPVERARSIQLAVPGIRKRAPHRSGQILIIPLGSGSMTLPRSKDGKIRNKRRIYSRSSIRSWRSEGSQRGILTPELNRSMRGVFSFSKRTDTKRRRASRGKRERRRKRGKGGRNCEGE